jgi:hypothetical protein
MWEFKRDFRRSSIAKPWSNSPGGLWLEYDLTLAVLSCGYSRSLAAIHHHNISA